MNKKSIFAGIAVVASVTVFLAINYGNVEETVSDNSSADIESRLVQLQEKPSNKQPGIHNPQTQQESTPVDVMVDELSAKMREQLADTIANIDVQVGLKAMRVDLEREFPGEGAQIFEQIVRRAFPELADQILLAISTMDNYDAWLVESYLDLNDMNPVARKNTIWDKRIALFGEEGARAIWNEEVAQSEERERNVKTVMHELNTAYDMPMADRVYTMKAAMDENYGSTPEGLMMGTGSVTTQLVFRLDSVQKELSAMTPEQRQTSINQMRLQLGFPEDRIEVLAAQDQQSSEMWEKGHSYMDERTALVNSYQGDDLETELDLLRLKHFDDRHAYSIKQEEAVGLMRYERERVYGLN